MGLPGPISHGKERTIPMEQKSLVAPDILSAFGLSPACPVLPLKGGHINDTFLVEDQGKFTLQRINRFVFARPQDIMENITGVTEFLRKKILARGGNPDRETLNIRRTVDGAVLYTDREGEPWRCMTYVDGASSRETVESAAMLREAGRAFGEFQKLLSDYPAHTLHETIANFHNTPERFRQLMDAVRGDKGGRVSQVGPELAFAAQREGSCSLLTDLLKEGKLPLRVTHNDTKMSNVLMDDATGKALCVIDLDTVMPGLAAFDFGDSIRTGATTAAEDEADLSKVHFDLGLFEAYGEGFLSAAGDALTPLELETLPDGAILMTFEVGIRFLADYLNGDVYFRTAYPEHNLVRARNQFRLVEEMEQSRSQMGDILRRHL